VKESRSKNAHPKGFHAMEMLIGVAIIATLAAVVIPQFTGTGTSENETPVAAADSSKDRANAQNIVSMWSAVAATGSQLPTTKEGCISALVNGIDVPFAGGSNRYQLNGMSPDAVASASRFIGFSNNGVPRLVFLPEGGP
jgi:Tfp pilus assembly protein FimT